jgi:hypothetical protein
MGERPSVSHSIDRIEVDDDYKPSNCRWATRREQNLNKRNTINLTIQGVTKTVVEWAELSKLPYSKILYRYHQNWPEERLLS